MHEPAYIRVVNAPAGEAPLEIREAWIGLVLPLSSRSPEPVNTFGGGVLSGPHTFLAILFQLLTGKLQRCVGYKVQSRVALTLLETHSPEAANWWRQNAPRFFKPGRYFLFSSESCERVAGKIT